MVNFVQVWLVTDKLFLVRYLPYYPVNMNPTKFKNIRFRLYIHNTLNLRFTMSRNKNESQKLLVSSFAFYIIFQQASVN